MTADQGDDSEHTDASVGVIGTESSKQKFGCSAKLDSITTSICELAFEQIIFVGEIVARDGMMIFDPQNKNATFRVSKSGHIFRHLVPNGAAVPWAFGTLKPLEQGLSIV